MTSLITLPRPFSDVGQFKSDVELLMDDNDNLKRMLGAKDERIRKLEARVLEEIESASKHAKAYRRILERRDEVGQFLVHEFLAGRDVVDAGCGDHDEYHSVLHTKVEGKMYEHKLIAIETVKGSNQVKVIYSTELV